MLKIGVVGPCEPDTFAAHILDSLPTIGAHGVHLGTAVPQLPGRRSRMAAQALTRLSAETTALAQRGLIRRARQYEFDAVVSVEQSLMPETVAAIGDTGAKVALWYPDHVANVGRMSMVAAPYDAVFLKDPLLTSRLQSVYQVPAFYLPEACNPQHHKPTGIAGSAKHIAVVGNLYPTRARLLKLLDAAGIPLRLYGPPFPRWYSPGDLRRLHSGRYVTCAGKSRVFREAAGVLNNLHPAELNSVNCRLFEAAAAGGAVLCENRPVLADLFALGDEVLAFNNVDELVAQCRFLIQDSDAGKRIGDAASLRARREHTYSARLEEMLALLVS